MKRRMDWPEKMAAEIERPWQWSETDYCVTFAARVVRAMTDEDPASAYAGLDLASAYREMRRSGYATVAEAVQAVLGEPVSIAMASRGDVVLRADGTAVGICCGEVTAFASDEGVAFLPTIEQSMAFRVPF